MELDEEKPGNVEAEEGSQSSDDSVLAIYPISEVQAHSDSVCSVSFSPTSAEVYASGGIDDVAFLYVGAEAKELGGHSDSIISVTFSSCGEYLAVASMDGAVSIWNAANGDSIAKYTGPTDEILSVSWHPRLPSICVLCNDLSLWIWHMRKNSPVAVVYGHPLNLAKFAPAGRFIYAAGKDGGLKAWDMKAENFDTSPPFLTVPGKELHADETISIDMNNNGLIITGSKDGTVGVTNLNSKRVISRIKVCDDSIESVEFCKELNWFLVASMSGDIKVYECDNLSSRCNLQVGIGIVKAIWINFEIYACGLEGFFECYDGRNGERLRKYVGTTETILDFDVKHGKIIAGSEDHRMFLWDAVKPVV